ncbi:unnamed protein product [Penicillium salamii]|uniref:Antifungal protein n=1 Tax=Penicillium salamii TaxID=1612424 RepID=A0A9W4K590_9EURO|nr:unnamed protein product [Penicillium salamii]CAG8001192.1 unnamed protein product [Penicillium salamii]CAG8108761.1 unnamed protein product [Penicillium salamii]CAG8109350.1 unnamed protein product [Penicillium salamii]CAG8183019.1 unnamed protein product [Penicillium salamii]
MQITKVAIFLFAAVGVVANPIAIESNDIDARASTKQQGQCDKKNNVCTYVVKGKTNKVKCGSATNKKCRNDRDACTYDTHHKKVDCQL